MSIFAMIFSLGNVAGNNKIKTLPQGSLLSSQRKSVKAFINEMTIDGKESRAFREYIIFRSKRVSAQFIHFRIIFVSGEVDSVSMKTTIFALVALAASFNTFAQAGKLKTRMLEVKVGLSVRVSEMLPKGDVKGDILYLHGFGDRLDNHMPLFKAWTDKGFRVISFDLPSHGESKGLFNNIDLHSFEDIIGFAEKVERFTREDDIDGPFMLAGWSTGGLLAVRAAQKEAFAERGVEGVILFAPAVSVPALVGRKGFLTQESLTSNPNPPHMGEITPKSPLLKPIFSGRLLVNAAAANKSLPHDLPVITIVAGETEDLYVNTPKVKEWAVEQRLNARFMRPAYQCKSAFHELDNEPGLVGQNVRDLAVEFAQAIASGQDTFKSKVSGPCKSF
ncbi:MAG TPA: alpha/beta fold hydrolase [Bacteriovoracaceae bacterium]|nr:alpha/beta fold hydrolase [Bacteriovoracaceae bacterium]